MVWLTGFVVIVCEILSIEMSKKTTESAKKYRNPVFLRVDVLVMVAQNSLIGFLKEHFLKELSKIFQMLFNILPKVWLILCCHSTKYKTWATIDILMTITPGVNMITREMTPFLSFAFWALSVAIFFGKIKIRGSYLNFPEQILATVETHFIQTLYFNFLLKDL